MNAKLTGCYAILQSDTLSMHNRVSYTNYQCTAATVPQSCVAIWEPYQAHCWVADQASGDLQTCLPVHSHSHWLAATSCPRPYSCFVELIHYAASFLQSPFYFARSVSSVYISCQ